ncbi:MAG: hypothetical protein FWG11_02180 [Promicromonosporaceae bacterium]|nr:hypothetical protein [Promicromonosporaceae bacterium]
MPHRLLSALVAVAAYAVTLTVAAILLPGMSISWWAGIIPVLLFTVAIVVLRPLIVHLTKNVQTGPHLLTLLVGVITVFVSLLICDLILSPRLFSISGLFTWIWATLIVTIGTLIYDVVDHRLIARADRAVSNFNHRRGK